jgi:hypothetical protein
VSSFSWLDRTDGDRRRVLEAIDRLRERETRDELGFGTIRNTFADLFFPGTTVMQTRPRYFLLVPWLYQVLARRPTARSNMGPALRKAEITLIDRLLAAGEADGVIGKRSKQKLLRTPSSIYWLGLRDWRICRFPGFQDDFHRSFARLDDGVGALRDDDGMALDGDALVAWDPGLPAVPAGFPEQVDLQLRRNEAAFLKERILKQCPGSLLAILARRALQADVDYVWMHPVVGELPADVARAVEQARLFALASHGAVLLYGLMLNEKLASPSDSECAERVDTLRTRLVEWAREAREDRGLSGWERAAFWSVVDACGPVRVPTRRFVEEWAELASWQRADGGADDGRVRAAITERERRLKGGRARLGCQRALELWNPSDDFARLDYRWPTAHRHLWEIHQALDGEVTRAGAA